MKQKVSKILSLICALALIVSCVSVGFVVSAEAVFEGSASFSVPTGTNHFANSKLTVAETDGTDWAIANDSAPLSATLATLTDGTVGNAASSKAFKVASTSSKSLLNADNNSVFSGSNRTGTVAQQTAAFMQVTFDLKGTVDNPEKFYYAGHYSSAAKLISAHYSIFASNTLYDLYDEANCLYTRIETPAAGSVTEGYRQNTINISSLNLTNVKYFGIRFYNRDNANYMVDASEVGLYGGTYTASKVVYTEYMDAPAEGTTYSTDNHLKDNGTVTYMVDGAVSGTGSMAATYYDGLPTSGYSEGAAFGFESANNSPFQYNTYMQYEYTLDNAINNPESFFFAQGSAYTDRASQRWTLFASSDKASLYNDESIVYEYLSNYGGTSSAYNAQPTEQTLDISALSLQNIKYVAIRFYHRSHAINYADGGQMLFISELGLYGGEVVGTVTPTVNLSLGTPVLTDDNIKIDVYMSGNNSEMCAVNYKVYSEDKLTPVTVESGTVSDSYVDGTENVPITFDAQGTKFENPKATGFQILNESYCEATLASGIKTAEGKIAEVYFAAPDTPGTYTFKLVGISGAAFVENATDVQDYVITVGDDVAYNYVAPPAEAKVTYLSDKTLPTDLGTNHFAGSTVAVSETGKSAYDNATKWETVINNNETQTFLGAKNATSSIFTADNNTVGQTEYYLQMTVTLPKTINNPTTFHYATNLAAASTSTSAHISYYYEIYASNNESDLYESKNSLGIIATDDTTTRQHKVDISEFELPEVKYFGIRFYHRPYSNRGVQITSIGLYGGEVATEEEESQITLEASVFDSKQGVNANDIMYKVDTSAVTGEITDMGIISGFKMNIDADDAFTDDYAEFLKANASTSIAKVSAPESVLDAENLFFHIHNSGTHNENDYSGYIVCTIAYVTVMESGTPTTYYSNVITKSSMQISRNQAKALKEGGKVVEGYEGYDFANDGNIDIAKVREFVEA